MKKIIVAAIIAILIGSGLLIYYKTKNGVVKYKTAPVQNGSLRATVTATGTVNAVKTVSVGTQVSGTLKELHVDFNSRVKKGQVIAEIDPATLQAQVDQARANVLVAKANVEKAKATLEDSKKARDRNRQLFSKSLIAKSDLDTSEATHDSNNAQVGASTAQVAQTEAALRFAETNLRYTKIVSPVDGIVVSRNVDIGQTVAASFQTPTLFTIAQDLTKMQIDTNIDEADIGKIETGQGVEFSVDAYPDNTFHGIVDQIRIAPITVQNVVTYDVVIRVDNGDLKLKPGMTANVTIIVASKDGILKIPNAALRFRPSEKEVPADSQKTAANRTSVRPSGPSDAATVRPSAADKNDGESSLLAGRRGRRPSGPSDETNAGISDSGRPGRRRASAADKEGKQPFGLSDGTAARSSGPEKNNAQASSQMKQEGTQSAPRRYTVWILENNKPKRAQVTIGISDGSFTEITSGDVREGQEIIVGTETTTPKPNNSAPPAGPRFIR
jgi:HlyD family secretion protein